MVNDQIDADGVGASGLRNAHEDPIGQLQRVTNCWTIYTPDNTNEPAIAEMGRPQDWGNPKWMYRVYVLEAQGYRNEVHCWVDRQMPEHEHLTTFASLICTIMRPGWDPKRSGREYLDEDDFWEEAWGEMPPPYEPEEDGDDG